MSTKTSQELNEILKAGLEAPGYWQWVFDEPERVYNDANDPPTNRPTGHWEWIPPALELFHQQQLSPITRMLVQINKNEAWSKGHRIPHHLRRKLDDPE